MNKQKKRARLIKEGVTYFMIDALLQKRRMTEHELALVIATTMEELRTAEIESGCGVYDVLHLRGDRR